MGIRSYTREEWLKLVNGRAKEMEDFVREHPEAMDWSGDGKRSCLIKRVAATCDYLNQAKCCRKVSMAVVHTSSLERPDASSLESWSSAMTRGLSRFA